MCCFDTEIALHIQTPHQDIRHVQVLLGSLPSGNLRIWSSQCPRIEIEMKNFLCWHLAVPGRQRSKSMRHLAFLLAACPVIALSSMWYQDVPTMLEKGKTDSFNSEFMRTKLFGCKTFQITFCSTQAGTLQTSDTRFSLRQYPSSWHLRRIQQEKL